MDELVDRLSKGLHPVVVALRPEPTILALKECIDRKYIHVKFTGTRGGTELSFPLDLDHTNLAGADFENQRGRIRVAGSLTLNYVRVRCIADIELESLAGQGRLEALDRTTADSS